MPTRILREGIIASETINALSPEAELFYRRLMSVADDYGRYYAHPSLLRGACYPLQLEKVSEKQVGKWLAECSEIGAIVVYGGGKWVFIPNFGQQIRGRSKFPEPANEELLSKCKADATQTLSNCLQAPHTHSTTTSHPNGFSKPTIDETKTHGIEIQLAAIECEKFFHYYESNGWRVGKNPMKSWQSAMQNWKRNVGNSPVKPKRYTPNI